MRKPLLYLAAALSFSWHAAHADAADEARSPFGYGSKGYVWGQMTRERAEALRLKADPVRGKEAFRACRGCHKAEGIGVQDGAYPRLTGQHAGVIIKQVMEVRAGIRINPKMDPFANDHAVSIQEIADISVYLAEAESLRENGKGPGDDVERGKTLYRDHQCYICHGERGEGSVKDVFPVVAGQHYGYLLREMKHIQEGTRGNSHPDMIQAIAPFSSADLEAVADYLSRLPDHRKTASAPQGANK